MAEVDDGELVADVARRHRVQPRTLSWWRWRLRSEAAAQPLLLPVVVKQGARSTAPASIELLIRDVVVRVSGDADVTYVAALVEALRGRC